MSPPNIRLFGGAPAKPGSQSADSPASSSASPGRSHGGVTPRRESMGESRTVAETQTLQARSNEPSSVKGTDAPNPRDENGSLKYYSCPFSADDFSPTEVITIWVPTFGKASEAGGSELRWINNRVQNEAGEPVVYQGVCLGPAGTDIETNPEARAILGHLGQDGHPAASGKGSKELMKNFRSWPAFVTRPDEKLVPGITEPEERTLRMIYPNAQSVKKTLSDMRQKHAAPWDKVQITIPPADLRGLELKGLDLRGFTFKDSDLRGTVFVNCKMDLLEVVGGTAEGAKFINCQLERSLFEGTNLKDTYFEKPSFEGAKITDTTIEQSNLKPKKHKGLTFEPKAEADDNMPKQQRKFLQWLRLR